MINKAIELVGFTLFTFYLGFEVGMYWGFYAGTAPLPQAKTIFDIGRNVVPIILLIVFVLLVANLQRWERNPSKQREQ